MSNWIMSGAPSFWIAAGLVLIGIETIAPGFFLLWLGLAAIATGLTGMIIIMGWQGAALAFVLFALISVGFGWKLTRSRLQNPQQSPDLNNRGNAMIGRQFVLDRPLIGGEGQIKVGDSVWRIIGPDMVTGASVRVVSIEGATLTVTAI
jgi:inner membrane protein